MPGNAEAEGYKTEGNAFFKAGNYAEAIPKYILATNIDPKVPAYWSNMSASYEKLLDWPKSASAAQSCIEADNKFVKGYFRLATAQKALNDLNACIKTLQSGLGVDSSNADLKKMKKEITELKRGEEVKAYCNKASEQMQTGDISGAYKTLELASRQDAGNADVERMMSKVRPKYEAAEKARKSGLSKTEKFKEQGDESYKKADFETAITKYTDCLKALGERESELAIKCLSNRSACYKQISNFDGTIEDCTAVLDVDPSSVKSLVRRAQAFEAVERYKLALEDVRKVMSMAPDKIGKGNYDVCNGMQGRLNRVIQQMKNMN